MCGIVGMVSTLNSGFNITQKDIFTTLLYADQVRGEDSTGVFSVNKVGNVNFLKEASDSSVFIKNNDYKSFMSDVFQTGRIVVGHNRKATRGTITDENAHPFVENKTILVHNGTLREHENLTDTKVNVDSHAILHGITEKGWRETLKSIKGAYALSWYNAEEKKLFLARNTERPLWLANTVGCWFFASEKEMLSWILTRNNVEIKDWTELKPNHVYEFSLEKLTEKILIRPFTPHEEKPTLPLLTNKKGEITSTKIDLFRGKKQNFKQEPTKKTKEKRNEGKKETSQVNKYSQDTFIQGQKLTIEISGCIPFKNEDAATYSGYLSGVVLGKPDLTARVFYKKEEKKSIETLGESPNDVLTATINMVYAKNGAIKSINCINPEPLVNTYSKNGEEILPDDYTFLNMSCQHCKKHVEWKEIPKSIVVLYRNLPSIKITCPTCLKDNR